MKRRTIGWAAAAMLLMACGGGQKSTPQEVAARVAQESYEALYGGRVEAFVDHCDGARTMPVSHRSQLAEGFRRHAAQVERSHKGVASVEVSRTEADTTLLLLQVFLVLGYGDDTKEEIVVPMVQRSGEWLMK